MAPRQLPRIIRNPGAKSIAGLKKRGYKRAGTRYGANVWTLPKAKAPKPPPGPYDQYRETAPWAIPLLQDLDTREKQHTGYVTGQVMPWLSQGLAALTGVDPSAPGYNPTIQQQYLANVQGPVGGTLNAAAAATPFAVQGPAGAPTGGPGAFLGQAMRQYSAQRGGAALMEAQATSALQTLQPNLYAQGAMRTIADYAAGLPAVYVEKRNELRSKIDMWVAEQETAKAEAAIEAAKFEETMRSNRVDESIRAMNAETNAAIQFGRLGIDASQAAGDQAGPAPTSVAPGYTVVPTDDGGWKVVRDPTVPSASSTTASGAPSAARGEFAPGNLRKQNYEGGWKSPAKARKLGWTHLTQATDGLWYGKRPKPGGAATRRDTTDLAEEFKEKYSGGGDPFETGSGGWVELYRGSPTKVTNAVTSWILKNRRSFTKPNGVVDADKLREVLGVVGGPRGSDTFSRAWAKIRPRIDARTGRWK